jgi:hypothetical protein
VLLPSLDSTVAFFRNHMMRHYGIRPFKCDTCEKRFTEERDMLKHKANAHGHARPHQCPHCEWSFKDVSALYGHAKRKHKVVLSRNQNRHLRHVQLSDEALMDLLVEECANKRSEEPTVCVLCRTQFQRRGNMYTHGKQIHHRDFHHLLKQAMRKFGLSFPKNPSNLLTGDDDDDDQPQKEVIVKKLEAADLVAGWAEGEGEEETVTEDPDISEMTPEFVETIAGGIVLEEGDLDQTCPICKLDCGDRAGLVKHGLEEHGIDFGVVIQHDKHVLMNVKLEDGDPLTQGIEVQIQHE